MARDRVRDELLVLKIEKDRGEFLRPTSGLVNLHRYKISFPVRSFPFAWFFVATEAAVIGLCTNHQSEFGPIQSIEHPTGPAFGGCPGNVLIELGVDALLMQKGSRKGKPCCLVML